MTESQQTEVASEPPRRNDHLASCWMAFQFLTRLPVPSPGLLTDTAAGRSLLYYPVVGIVLALLLVLLNTLLWLLPDNWGVQAFIILAFWVFLTGGLHLDGLADTADAWVGGLGDRERSLAIMKDPCAGPAAVTVLLLLLLGKWVFLASLLEQYAADWWMAPIVARVLVVLLMTTTPYVRSGGLGEHLALHCNQRDATTVLIIALVVALFAMDFIALALVLVVFAGLRWTMMKRLGGTTGDTAGASIELLEWTFLLGLLI